jgi:hypothetical protein
MINLSLTQKRNDSDLGGSIWNTQNMTFDKRGAVTLAPRVVAIYTADDDAQYGDTLAIVGYGSAHVVLTTDGIFEASISNLSISQNADLNVPSTGELGHWSDAVQWQNRIYVSKDDDVAWWAGGDWTNLGLSLTADVPHPLCVFESFAGGYLAIANGNTVNLRTTAHADVATLTIPADFEITSMRYRQTNLYIGTKHLNGGEAKLFIWNGSGSAAQQGYGVGSDWIFSLADYDSSICLVTNAGQLLRFNGGGFSELANFPVYYSEFLWQQGSSGLEIGGKVFNRGMIADGSNLYIVIDGSVVSKSANVYPSGFLENQPSGVWCYDPSVGLYPRHLTTTDKYRTVNVSAVDTSTYALTLASAIDAETGDPIHIAGVGSLTGISLDNTYFAIKDSPTTIRLAYTPADAFGDFPIEIGGTVGGASVYVLPNNKIGDLTDVRQGAISTIYTGDQPPEFLRSNIIWGTRATAVGSTTALDALNILSLGRNVGSLTTGRIYGESLKETWQRLIQEVRNLNFDTDSLVIKYRTTERFGLPTVETAGTWISPTSFFANGASTALNQPQEGDEVVILSGAGAGRTAHLTAAPDHQDDPDFPYGRWIVSLDESIPNASSGETMTFHITNFKKAEIVTNQMDLEPSEVSIGTDNTGPWVQFKLEPRGFGIEVIAQKLMSEINK